MTLRIMSTDEHVWTLAPQGRLDLPAARALEDALNELCDAGHARLVVDMAGVAYVASAALKALLVGARRARLLEGDVRLAGLNERVFEVFEMAGFDQIFAIHPTAQAAAESFGAPAAPAA
jgi:anti-sigma B factor antagonist